MNKQVKVHFKVKILNAKALLSILLHSSLTHTLAWKFAGVRRDERTEESSGVLEPVPMRICVSYSLRTLGHQ